MFRFITKVVIFSLPLLLLFALPLYVVTVGREYISVADVIATQQVHPETLMSFAYRDVPFYQYKQALVATKQPTVIALGTSRVMQFRSELFSSTTVFINAGGAGKTVESISNFINNLPAGGPTRLIILGLDAEVFTSLSAAHDVSEDSLLPIRAGKESIMMARRMYLDYAAHKYTLGGIAVAASTSSNIGLQALLHNDGFRSDGSYRYGAAEVDENRRKAVAAQVVAAAASLREASLVADTKRTHLIHNAELLSGILAIAKSKGIVVIGIMTPYPTALYEAKQKNDPLFLMTRSILASTFGTAALPFFDFSALTTFGGNDNEFVDTVHPTDLAYLRMTTYMAEHNKNLAAYTDSKILRQTLASSTTDFLPF